MTRSICDSTFKVVTVLVLKKEYVCIDTRIVMMTALMIETKDNAQKHSLLKPPTAVFV